ncbi:hypothetical protein Q7C36_013669 [Tachysurus vachellii]|uniref:Uncharacterized protein n=1 Tax=Tachysurus vachellii TaxID=175792 RepID=A0AA88MID7_TACVA|nr:hypothetical protein Q7C36_013669 [Tachysurus vachellii]
MNAVSGFIFLLSVIANCHFLPLTEFDLDFQEIENLGKSYQHCPVNCPERNSTLSTTKSQNSECQCFIFPHDMNCTHQVIEHGLRKLNIVCNSSDTQTHKTCRILERLMEMNIVGTNQSLCGTLVSPRHIMNYIRMVHQKSNSIIASKV